MHNFFPIPLLISIGMLIVFLAVLWKRKCSPSYLFFFSLFWLYLMLVLRAAIFPIPLPGNHGQNLPWQRAIFILDHVNLIPLNYGMFPTTRFLISEITGNILLTAPFGFGVNFIACIKARGFLWLAPVVGLAIEITQLLVSLSIGGVYRSVDINDVILNVIGVWLGYGLFRIFAKGFLKLTSRGGSQYRGLTAYIQKISSRV